MHGLTFIDSGMGTPADSPNHATSPQRQPSQGRLFLSWGGRIEKVWFHGRAEGRENPQAPSICMFSRLPRVAGQSHPQTKPSPRPQGEGHSRCRRQGPPGSNLSTPCLTSLHEGGIASARRSTNNYRRQDLVWGRDLRHVFVTGCSLLHFARTTVELL